MDFVHDDPDFDALLQIVATERGLNIALVEKDYWVTHTLWALQEQGFEAIAPMFWGPRLALEDACAELRRWLDNEFRR